MSKRGAGILLPVFSLPSAYGIGTLGKEAYRFIDFLERAGQKFWQILPMSPTGYGDSPYQSVSAFAGNPYMIDLDDAASFLGLSNASFERLSKAPKEKIDYFLQYEEKHRVLRELYLASPMLHENRDYLNFLESEREWLDNFCFFMAFKKKFGYTIWQSWPAYPTIDKNDEEEIDFWRFVQFLFFKQYRELRKYAHEHGVSIIGDMPLYVSLDSADVWGNRSCFLLDESGYPSEVSGVPPDIFSEDGQKWGNPLYNWAQMESEGFEWWCRRIEHSMKMYDKVRIDHFIGLVNYYAIKAASETAREGVWREAPGGKLLEILCGMNASLIAEDLGVINEKVILIRDKFALPGMKILQFAFDSDSNNPFLPHSYPHNCIVYGGTHDNETLVGHFSHASGYEFQHACQYLGIETESPAVLANAIIRAGYASCADTVIMTMQDLMGLGNETRCNTPSTTEGNWQYRLPEDWETKVSSDELFSLAKLYGRI